jgi:hypothetical protein
MVLGLVDLVKPVDQEVLMEGLERNVKGRSAHEQVTHSAGTAFPSLNVVRVASR